MRRSLLKPAQTGWSINVAKPPYRCWRSPPFLYGSLRELSIRSLRDVDRPPRRSLSLESDLQVADSSRQQKRVGRAPNPSADAPQTFRLRPECLRLSSSGVAAGHVRF